MKQKSIFVKLAKSAFYAYKISKMRIPDKRQLYRTLFGTYLLGLKLGSKKMAAVQGYKVNFTDYQSFIHLLETIFFQREYAVKLDASPGLIIDCGSNIGISILFFHKQFPGTKIVGFEPDPAAYQSLKSNILNNKLSDLVSIHPIALCDYQGKVDFFIDPDVEGSLFMSTVSERMPKQKISVACEKLSDYVTQPVGLLKLDIEGSEMQVLGDLVGSKKLDMVSHLLIEYHHHIRQKDDVVSELFNLLEDQGFGYQIRAEIQPPFAESEFQDILVYAYRKN